MQITDTTTMPIFYLLTQLPLLGQIVKQLDVSSIRALAFSNKQFYAVLLDSNHPKGEKIKKFLWSSLCQKHLKKLTLDKTVLLFLMPKLFCFKESLSANEMIETIKFSKAWDQYTKQPLEQVSISHQTIFKKIVYGVKGLLKKEKKMIPIENWINRKKLDQIKQKQPPKNKTIPVENWKKFMNFYNKYKIPRKWFKGSVGLHDFWNADPSVKKFLIQRKCIKDLFRMAIFRKDLNVMKIFIECEMGINKLYFLDSIFQEDTIAVLHLCVVNDFFEGVKLLLSTDKIDVNIKTGISHYTPLRTAIVMEHWEIIKLLLEDERVDVSGISGTLLLIAASDRRDLEMVQLLIKRKMVGLTLEEISGDNPWGWIRI